MREGPGNRFAAAGFIVSDGVIESEFKAALGRIGNGLHAVFEIQPAGGLAFTVALKAFEVPRREQGLGRILRMGGGNDGCEQDRADGGGLEAQ